MNMKEIFACRQKNSIATQDTYDTVGRLFIEGKDRVIGCPR